MSTVGLMLTAFAAFSFAYFALINTVYLVLTALAWRSVMRYSRSRPQAATDAAFASPLTPGVSVLVPAYNEEAGIVESVRSLLSLRYPRHEVIVVNDGSDDATLARLREEFDLVPVRRAMRGTIPSQPHRAVYRSRRDRDLCVIDKENGGRADALNAGLDAARYPYVCAVDADGVIEEDALLRVAIPILDDPDLVVATGGILRIANGCRIDHGRVVEVGLPKSRLATLQAVEYFRAFLVGRVGWSSLNSLVIISGAFGLFRRSLIEDIGGYSTETVCEDLELILRLHRHLHEQDEEYRIEFVADPVVWTEAPEDLGSLSSQRRRWQRGLGESLWRHRRLIGNPRYGPIGLVALPFLLLEFFGAVVEVAGLPAALAAFALGELSAASTLAFLVVSVLFGMLLSVAALTLEEFSFRRYLRGREAGRLLWYAVLENFGYRQLVSLWRAFAFVDLARGKKDWGVHRRRGISGSITPREPSDEDPQLKPAGPASDTQPAPASSLRRLPELPDRALTPGQRSPTPLEAERSNR